MEGEEKRKGRKRSVEEQNDRRGDERWERFKEEEKGEQSVSLTSPPAGSSGSLREEDVGPPENT